MVFMSLGPVRGEDNKNLKTISKTNPAKDEKANNAENSSDEIFEQENGISLEKTESNQSVREIIP